MNELEMRELIIQRPRLFCDAYVDGLRILITTESHYFTTLFKLQI
jgi:hypothetical protein